MDDPVPRTSEPQAMQEITEYIDIAETGAPPPGYLSSAAFTQQFFENLLVA